MFRSDVEGVVRLARPGSAVSRVDPDGESLPLPPHPPKTRNPAAATTLTFRYLIARHTTLFTSLSRDSVLIRKTGSSAEALLAATVEVLKRHYQAGGL